MVDVLDGRRLRREKMERSMKTQKRFYRSESQMDLAKYWDHGEHFAMQNRSADFGMGLAKL